MSPVVQLPTSKILWKLYIVLQIVYTFYVEVILPAVIIFMFGAVLGSFLNVLIDRLPRQETVARGRSKCESCRHVLGPIDLIPIFSYASLLGRCRYCHAKIPARLTLVELIGGLLASSLFLYYFAVAPSLFVIFLFIVLMCFIGIFFADQSYGIIPDEFIIVIVAATGISLFFYRPELIIEYFLTGLVSFLLFLGLHLVTRGKGMGFGDVKLAFAMGFFLGFPRIIVGFYTAFLSALLVALVLVFLGRKKLKGGTIAFGPYLALGTIVAYFFGSKILDFVFK